TRVMRHAVAMAAGVASDAATPASRPPVAPKEGAERGAHDLLVAQPAQRYPLEATRVLRDAEDVERGAHGLSAVQPAPRYPRIVEAAAAMSEHDDADADCAFGVDLLLAGVEVLAARKGPARE
ncbi:MAG: hypothetical protein ACRDJE_00530, partial [Dehalococcoidia bacterium]